MSDDLDALAATQRAGHWCHLEAAKVKARGKWRKAFFVACACGWQSPVSEEPGRVVDYSFDHLSVAHGLGEIPGPTLEW